MKKVPKRASHTHMYILLYISAHFDLASTKSSHSPNWRVQNLFGECEIEVTRHFGEDEFFLMSNPGVFSLHLPDSAIAASNAVKSKLHKM